MKKTVRGQIREMLILFLMQYRHFYCAVLREPVRIDAYVDRSALYQNIHLQILFFIRKLASICIIKYDENGI